MKIKIKFLFCTFFYMKLFRDENEKQKIFETKNLILFQITIFDISKWKICYS